MITDKGLNETQPILTPENFVEYLPGENTTRLKSYHSALICFDPECYKHLKNKNKRKIVERFTGELILLENNVLLGGLMGIGSPASVAFMEELIACGVKRFVFLGTAGRLHQNLNPAELVICGSAISEEGTSKCYPEWREEVWADARLLKDIKGFIADTNTSFKEVKAWTTDAPFMETGKKLEYYLNKRADVVEMEASAVFAIASYRKVKAAALFVISDSLAKGQWVPYFGSEQVKNIQIDAANRLITFLSHKKI